MELCQTGTDVIEKLWYLEGALDAVRDILGRAPRGDAFEHVIEATERVRRARDAIDPDVILSRPPNTLRTDEEGKEV